MPSVGLPAEHLWLCYVPVSPHEGRQPVGALFRCKFSMHNAGMITAMPGSRPTLKTSPASFAQLNAAGCDKVFREKITGTTADRPQIKKLMAALADGHFVEASRE
jgi:hypothetical protein